MHKKTLRAGALVAAFALSLGVAACGGDDNKDSSSSTSSTAKAGKVAVLLPDTKSSARWEGADKPFLEQAFKAAGVDADDLQRPGRQVRPSSSRPSRRSRTAPRCSC